MSGSDGIGGKLGSEYEKLVTTQGNLQQKEQHF